MTCTLLLVLKLEAVGAAITLVLWIYCLLDVIRTDAADTRHLGKVYWIVLVLLFPLVGSVAWLAVGRPRRAAPRAHERAAPQFPEYDRPGRAAATAAEGDDEFLKQVRERAEEQRRRHRQQRLQWEREQRGEAPEA